MRTSSVLQGRGASANTDVWNFEVLMLMLDYLGVEMRGELTAHRDCQFCCSKSIAFSLRAFVLCALLCKVKTVLTTSAEWLILGSSPRVAAQYAVCFGGAELVVESEGSEPSSV
jgi:hypothetical protein